MLFIVILLSCSIWFPARRLKWKSGQPGARAETCRRSQSFQSSSDSQSAAGKVWQELLRSEPIIFSRSSFTQTGWQYLNAISFIHGNVSVGIPKHETIHKGNLIVLHWIWHEDRMVRGKRSHVWLEKILMLLRIIETFTSIFNEGRSPQITPLLTLSTPLFIFMINSKSHSADQVWNMSAGLFFSLHTGRKIHCSVSSYCLSIEMNV